MMPNDALVFDLYQLFRQRCEEVKRYVEFVVTINEHRMVALGYIGTDESFKKINNGEISRELNKTLRANTFLLLYNLVEATMTTAIDTIHQAIKIDELVFDALSKELQNVSLTHFKRAVKSNHNSAHERQHPIQHAMVYLGYDKENLFSGNVDTKEIMNIAQKYGFITPDPNRKGRDIAKKMKDIRDKRNGLAHGRLSFEECGEDTATEYLETVTRQTITYLRAVLWSISRYLRLRTYLAAA